MAFVQNRHQFTPQIRERASDSRYASAAGWALDPEKNEGCISGGVGRGVCATRNTLTLHCSGKSPGGGMGPQPGWWSSVPSPPNRQGRPLPGRPGPADAPTDPPRTASRGPKGTRGPPQPDHVVQDVERGSCRACEFGVAALASVYGYSLSLAPSLRPSAPPDGRPPGRPSGLLNGRCRCRRVKGGRMGHG